MLLDWISAELVSGVLLLASIAGLEAVGRIPDAEGDELAACVLILLALSAACILAYATMGLVIPLFILATLAVLLVIFLLI